MEEYHIGGYYLIEGTTREDYMSNSIIPNNIWSVSSCICNLHPDISALSWTSRSNEDRLVYQQQLNLTTEAFNNMQEKTDALFNDDKIGWEAMFIDRDTAVTFAQKYLGKVENIKLMMIATTTEYSKLFLQKTKTTENNNGVYKCLQKENAVQKDADFKGFEILGYESGSFHSFICYNLEKVYANNLNITLNEHGLIKNYAEAVIANDYTSNSSNLPEGTIWMPWAIYEIQLSK